MRLFLVVLVSIYSWGGFASGDSVSLTDAGKVRAIFDDPSLATAIGTASIVKVENLKYFQQGDAFSVTYRQLVSGGQTLECSLKANVDSNGVHITAARQNCTTGK